MSQLPDHYSALHVQPGASTEQIKRMYHLLAKRYHPDRVPPERQAWAREQMARINVAYETLSDPQKRAELDCRHGYRESVKSGRVVWRGQRLRERTRRQHSERWRYAFRFGLFLTLAALLCVGVVLLLRWLFPGEVVWLDAATHWLALDTPLGRRVWALVALGAVVLLLTGRRLIEW